MIMASYPQLIINLTDGEKDTKVSLPKVKASLVDNDVKLLGRAFAKLFPNGTTYINSDLITSVPIGQND